MENDQSRWESLRQLPLPESALLALKGIGEPTDDDRAMWQWRVCLGELGEEFLYHKIEVEGRLRRIFPIQLQKLRNYEADCRRVDAIPQMADLSTEDLERFRIIRQKSEEIGKSSSRRIFETPHRGAFVVSSLPGLAALKESFREFQGNLVFLTQPEFDGCRELLEDSDDDPWLFAHFSLDFSESFDRLTESDSLPEDFRPPPIPSPGPDEVAWYLTRFLAWGSLAGGSTTELWFWNGREARYSSTVECLTF